MVDRPKITFVSSCRLNGRTLFLLERFRTNLSDPEVVQETNGSIPAFLSEQEARAEIPGGFHEAPRPQRFDPMKMFAMHENIMNDPDNRDFYELVLLGMKLSGTVIVSQEARKPPERNMEFPDMAELWPATDFPRLGGILLKGIDAFERRVIVTGP